MEDRGRNASWRVSRLPSVAFGRFLPSVRKSRSMIRRRSRPNGAGTARMRPKPKREPCGGRSLPKTVFAGRFIEVDFFLRKLIFSCRNRVFCHIFFPNSALPSEFHSALVSGAPTDSVIEDHARNPLSRAVGALTVSSQKDFGAYRENPIHKSSDLAPKLRHKTRAASKL